MTHGSLDPRDDFYGNRPAPAYRYGFRAMIRHGCKPGTHPLHVEVAHYEFAYRESIAVWLLALERMCDDLGAAPWGNAG